MMVNLPNFMSRSLLVVRARFEARAVIRMVPSAPMHEFYPIATEGEPQTPVQSSIFFFQHEPIIDDPSEEDIERIECEAMAELERASQGWRWVGIAWRVLPEWETSKDFELRCTLTTMFFRGVFFGEKLEPWRAPEPSEPVTVKISPWDGP